MDTPNFKLPDYYINRELSALEFNRRVLYEAANRNTPLLERLKFLCITSTNLDEFFEIRVSGLQQRLELGSAPAGPDMQSPKQVLDTIGERTHELVTEQYRLLNEELIPELEANDIRFIRRTRWNPQQLEWLRNYFNDEVEPVLSPITLDPARPFPRILNKSLNFIVGLEGVHAFGRPCSRAIVQAPRSLPRLIRLSPELPDTGPNDFVFLSSVIHAFVDELFAGMEITGCYQFRVTRNSDLYVDEEEVDDLMRALEGELIASRYGAAVRLEVADQCPEDLTGFLLDMFGLEPQDLYPVPGPVNLNRLMAVYNLMGREDLKDPAFTPGLPKELVETDDIFTAIAAGDVLVHHPFESFSPVMEFINRAAQDPDVLALKITLYRTGPDSAIVKSLVAAAQAGKEVTVSIELRARFDEAANIELANRLQTAGAHVVYGVRGFKTHCKMAMVVRRENGQLKRYVHLGTGNYHPGSKPVISVQNVWHRYDSGSESLRQVKLELRPGEFVTLMGRNGSGKSTLLKSLVGLVRPHQGKIHVLDMDVATTPLTELTQQVGFVPQNPGRLLFQETVAGEVDFTRRAHQLPPVDSGRFLEPLGLTALAGAYPRDLSSGERQRTALAAILAAEPKILLLDEPTRGLDYRHKAQLTRILKELSQRQVTIIMATHDVELAAHCADRVVIMGEGQVVVDGPVRAVMTESLVFASQVNKLLRDNRFLTVEDVMQQVAATRQPERVGR